MTLRTPIRLGALIVLSLVFALAGTAGAIRYVQTFWLYRGFAAPQQARTVFLGAGLKRHSVPVYAGTVRTFTLTSPALGGRHVPIVVYLPPHYSKAGSTTRYPVMYLLHGEPGEPIQFINIGDAATTSDTLIAERRIEPMILVMPTGGFGFLSDQEWANSIKPDNDWETYVAHDLVQAIDHRYRTIASGSQRAIGGLSEGGYGALNIGIHHPGEFDLIEAWSPYYEADVSPELFGHNQALLAYNSPEFEVTKAAPKLRANHAYVWFYTGSKDRYKKASLNFRDELRAYHIANTYFVSPGHHNWKLWRALMPNALETASHYFQHGPPALSNGR